MKHLISILVEMQARVLTKECREIIVNRIITSRADLPVSTCNTLDKVIKKTVRIKGFRDPLKAPVRVLQSHIVAAMPNSPTLQLEIVDAWVLLNEELAKAARESGIEERLDKAYQALILEKDSSLLMQMLREDSEHLLRKTDCSDCEGLLMLIHMIGEKLTTGEVEDEIAATTVEEKPSVPNRVCWDELLERIEAQPAHLAGWDGYERFIEDVRRVAQVKLKEKNARIAMDNAISLLFSECAQGLEFFESTSIIENVRDCASEEIVAVTAMLQELYGLLKKHQELHSTFGATYAEDRLRRETLVRVETDIIQIVDSIKSVVLPSPDPDAAKESDAMSVGPDSQREAVPKESSGQSEVVSKQASPLPVADLGIREPSDDEGNTSDHIECESDMMSVCPDSQPEATSKESLDQGDAVSEQTLPPTEAVPDRTDSSDDGSIIGQIERATGLQSNIDRAEPDQRMESPPAREPEIQIPKPELETPHENESNIADSNASAVATMLWEALNVDDIAKAYWLSVAAAIIGTEVCLSPWILKAFFYSRYLSGSSDARDRLYQIVYEHPKPMSELTAEPYLLDPREASLLITAVAAESALVCPETATASWLIDDPQLIPAPLTRVWGHIHDFSQYQHSLASVFVPHDEAAIDLTAELKNVSRRAEEWLTRAGASRLNYAPASRLLHYMVSEQHELGRIARIVARNKKTEWDEVKRFLDSKLCSTREMNNLLEAASREIRSAQCRTQIEGKAQKRLMDYLLDLRSICGEWSKYVELEQNDHSTEWIRTKANDFRDDYLADFKDVEDWLALQRDTGSDRLRILAQKAAEALTSIKSLLEGHPKRHDIVDPQELMAELCEPLVFLSPFPVTEEYEAPQSLSKNEATRLIDCYREGKTINQAFQQHLAEGDYWAALFCRDRLVKQGADATELNAQYDDAYLADKEGLRQKCASLRARLEQATIDHVLSESEKATKEADLLAVENSTSKRINMERRKLDTLEEEIIRLRENRIHSLREVLDSLRENLNALDGSVRSRANAFFDKTQDALDSNDLALADEYLAQAEHLIRYGEAYDEPASDNSLKYELEEFVRVHGDLYRALEERHTTVYRQLANGKSLAGLDMRQVPGSRLKEIGKALESFSMLRAHDGRGHKESSLKLHLKNVLEYLGFIEPQISVKVQEKTFCHINVRISGSVASPVPEFGSLRNGMYDVLLLWGRPAAETIRQCIENTGLSGSYPIVLFLGRMTMPQRKEWADQCRSNRLTALLCDELLLCFVATERQNRFPVLVNCSLPFSYANPYTPFGAGNVPPEMFKGRHEIVQGIMAPNGPAVIFGGRQLGKSAILKRAEQLFHDPAKKHFVFFDDIRNVGSPEGNQPTTDIWDHLRNWLVGNKLLRPSVSNKPDRLIDAITRLFEREPQLRILYLLDEADRFLVADADKDFEVVHGLKKIMDATSRRFKVVFSGLHSVQRFSAHSNHPFAHLDKENIRPLEGKAARMLIVEPLYSLGYRLEQDAIYRILAYTNYQPALIQHLCRELVKSELASRRFKDLPIRLTMESVEAVYRNPVVRKEMNDRFEWTIGLDKRYECLVYAVIYDQMEEKDGYRKEYTYREIIQMASDWWGEGFKSLGDDHGRSLLDELVGLGVMVKIPERGTYRIRNANIVRALGTQGEIEDRLMQFIDLPAPEFYIQQSIRRCIDENQGWWSPLTIAQESYLLGRPGVALIFGSDALGCEYLDPALELLANPGGSRDSNGRVFLTLPPECMSLKTVTGFVRSQMKNFSSGRIILHAPAFQLTHCDASLVEIVEHITSVLNQYRKARDRAIHFWITFRAEDTINWCSLPVDKLTAVEDRVGSVVCASRWDGEMIRRFLVKNHMMSSGQVCTQVLEETGGWPLLIDRFYQVVRKRYRRIPDELDPRPLLREVLDDPDGRLKEQFVNALGIADHPIAMNILHVLKMLDDLTVSIDELVYYVFTELQEDKEKVQSYVEALRRLGVIVGTNELVKTEPVSRRAVLG